ncbi:MAG: aldehyde dehydrogenase family protein [Roseobacter sp.]
MTGSHKSPDVEFRRTRARAIGEHALQWYRELCAADVGDKRPAFSGEVPCFDPSLGEEIWNVPESSQALIDTYVVAAKAVQADWAALPAPKRARMLLACADALEQEKEALSEVLALETGKALTHECRTEVGLPVEIFRYFAGLVHEIKGKTMQAAPGLMGFTTHHPWGVIAGVVPWNMPLMFMAYKVAAPLAAGNTVLIKMPEQATATLAMALRIILPLLPNGTVRFVSGSGGGSGERLISHLGVDKVSFTGSVDTGRSIYQRAAAHMRPVTLELGGKSPMIILEDCDIPKAVGGVLASMRFTRSGQSCTASSRIYVPRNLMPEYKSALGEALNALRLGDALDTDTDCGPVVTRAQKTSIDRYIELAKNDNLDVQAYGNSDDAVFERGFYVRPHLIFDPDHVHPVSQEEIFGPVATLSGYDGLGDALALANGTQYGLSASIWGRDINACLTCAAAFRAGIVQINQNAIMLPGFSYGGVGISGVGKESSLEAMLETYMYEKTNIVNFSG